MGARHSHGGSAHPGSGVPVHVGRRTTAVLWVLVAAITLGTVGGVALLWPRGEIATGADTRYTAQEPVEAVVVSARERTCEGLNEDRLPDGSVPAQVRCADVAVRLEAGPERGRTVQVQVPGQVYATGVVPGTRVTVTPLPPDVLEAAQGQGGTYAFHDFSRAVPLQLLAVVFVLLVVGVARWRGLAALVGLALGYLTVLKFMLPALRSGSDPALVSFVGCVAIMVVILYVAHGVSAKTTTALLGTVAGLAVTAVLARWAVGATHLNGLNGENSLTLTQLVGLDTLRGVVVCGLILAGLGILNDVTVTQASAVWELREHAPHLGARRLFGSGMRIGRDHLASTVYTIAFAYAGAALPTLLLIDLYARPLGQVLTTGEIAEEVVRTLVGGIGLILAIPLTTAIAAVVVTAGGRASAPPTDGVPAGLLDRATPSEPVHGEREPAPVAPWPGGEPTRGRAGPRPRGSRRRVP